MSSFSHAIAGLKTAFKHEKNFRIQTVVAIAVIVLALYFEVQRFELLILVLTIALVLAMEIINSMLERLVDLVKPRLHTYVKEMKDIMAGGVLVVSLAAVVVGLIIFIPYIADFLSLPL